MSLVSQFNTGSTPLEHLRHVFKQIFTEHWEGCKPFRPRSNTPDYDDLVDKRLRCGNPDQIGSIAYRCLHCGQGKHRVAMSCKRLSGNKAWQKGSFIG